MSVTFIKLSRLMCSVANKAADCHDYWDSWTRGGPDFIRKEISVSLQQSRDVFTRDKIFNFFTFDDIRSMKDDEQLIIGIVNWDDSGLCLIPKWLFYFIADGQEFISICRDKKIKGKNEIDLDTRGGVIAWGFMK